MNASAVSSRGNASVHVGAAVALMLLSLVLSLLLRPTRYWADVVGQPDLERIIPAEFGDWTQSPYGANVVVSPRQQEALAATYDSTLARVYLHKPSGRLIMLSLAYGRDQSVATQAHPPEMCYGPQGFRIDGPKNGSIPTDFGAIKAARLHTELGLRHEPVSYFFRVGDSIARGSLERNLERLSFARKGYLVDGLLFRVSEITDKKDAFDLQDKFVRDLLNAVSPAARRALVGDLGALPRRSSASGHGGFDRRFVSR
jgi:EpsI family protein